MSVIEQSGLILVHLFEDGSHEGLADETAAVGDIVMGTETIKRPELTLVQQNGNSMFAGKLFQWRAC